MPEGLRNEEVFSEKVHSEGVPAEAPPPARSLGRTILRNSLFVSSGGGAIRLLGFAFTILVVRLLGDTAYGQYVTALAFTAMLGIFFELGTTQYFERTIAQDRSKLADMLSPLISLRLLLAFAGIFVITGLAIALGYEQIIVICVLLQTISYVSAAVLFPLQAVLTAHERYDLWTTTHIIGQLCTMALGTAVLWMGGGLLWLIATGMVVMPIQIIYCLFVIRRGRIGPLGFHFKMTRFKELIAPSLPFALSALALTVSFNVDTFLLSLLEPSEVVGWYGAAYRLVPTIVSLLGGFLTVITPSLARAYVTDREGVRRWTKTSIKWLMIFSLPAAIGVSVLAASIIGVLYGESFAPSAVVLAIIAWDIPLRLFNAFAGNVTTAVNLERTAWRIFMTGTVLGVILYVPAIMLYGILGAAVVTVAMDGINTVLFLRLLNREMQSVQVGVLLRTLAAGLLMGAIVWVVYQNGNLFVSIGTGVLSYVVLAFAFGLVDRATLHRILGLLQPRRVAS